VKVSRSFGEERISSIFWVEEFTNQETSKKQAARRDWLSPEYKTA
jgi:hypothetical protein